MSGTVHAVVLHRFDVPPERVFDACLDPAWAGRWMSGPHGRSEPVLRLQLEARVGGKFSFVVHRQGTEIEQQGEYLAIDRPELLVFTWATRDTWPDTGRVVIEITPLGPGCEVKLTHVMGAHWSAQVDEAAAAWSRMLEALKQAIADEGAAVPASTEISPP